MLITPENLKTVVISPSKNNPVNTNSINTASQKNIAGLKQDTVEISNQNNKTNFQKNKKTIIAAVLTAIGSIAAGYTVAQRYDYYKFMWKLNEHTLSTDKNLIKESLDMYKSLIQNYNLKNGRIYKEYIDFEPAKTVEEAQKFARKFFNIKNFNIDNLEIANWVNETFVKFNNKFKGQRLLPANIEYKNSLGKDETVATMSTNLFDLSNSTLYLSKKYYQKADYYLELLNYGKLQGRMNKGFYEKTVDEFPYIPISLEKYLDFVKRYKEIMKNPNKYTAPQKIAMFNEYISVEKQMTYLKEKENIKEYITYLKNKNLQFSEKISEKINNFDTLSQNEALELLTDIVKENNLKVAYGLRPRKETSDIFHELGHLAFKEKFLSDRQSVFEQNIHILEQALQEVQNKLDLYRRKNIVKRFFLLKKLPKVPKYPKTNDLNLDLPEELGKEEKMIAGFISNYAMTSPSEFIAETFSALCERPIEEFSDDIINLYKKYKGPMLEFFENNTI